MEGEDSNNRFNKLLSLLARICNSRISVWISISRNQIGQNQNRLMKKMTFLESLKKKSKQKRNRQPTAVKGRR